MLVCNEIDFISMPKKKIFSISLSLSIWLLIEELEARVISEFI